MFRTAGSIARGSTDCDAEGLEKAWPGCRIDESAFVEKVSGGRLTRGFWLERAKGIEPS
jgi:hypothetical protein